MQFVNTKDELRLLQQEVSNQNRTLQDLIVKADFIVQTKADNCFVLNLQSFINESFRDLGQ